MLAAGFGGDLDGPFFHVNDDGAVTGGQHNASGPFGGGFCSAFSLPHCHHHGPRGDDPYPDEDTKGCPEPKGAFGPDCPTKCDTSAAAWPALALSSTRRRSAPTLVRRMLPRKEKAVGRPAAHASAAAATACVAAYGTATSHDGSTGRSGGHSCALVPGSVRRTMRPRRASRLSSSSIGLPSTSSGAQCVETRP